MAINTAGGAILFTGTDARLSGRFSDYFFCSPFFCSFLLVCVLPRELFCQRTSSLPDGRAAAPRQKHVSDWILGPHENSLRHFADPVS